MYWNLREEKTEKQQLRLTLTWDVLKYVIDYFNRIINKININMRCIEISIYKDIVSNTKGLTLTWEVLK